MTALLARADRLAAPLRPLALCLTMGFVTMLIAGILMVLLKLGVQLPWLLRITISDLPYFALGVVMFRRGGDGDALFRLNPLVLALPVLAYLAHSQLGPQLGAFAALLRVFYATSLCMAICLALLQLFRRFCNRTTPALRFMSGAIYSVYLWHYLLIYLVAAPLHALGVDRFTLWHYALIVGLAMAAGGLMHGYLFSRIDILSLLFTGKRREKLQDKPI